VVHHTDEINPRPNLRLDAFYEEVEERPDLHILHNQAARFDTRFDAALSADLRRLLGPTSKRHRRTSNSNDRARERTRPLCNCLQTHSRSPFDANESISFLHAWAEYAHLDSLVESETWYPARRYGGFYLVHRRC